MRLFLTSDGFPAASQNLRRKFIELVNKEPKDIKVAFIPTASEVEDDRSFMLLDRGELEEIGVPKENITTLELDHAVTIEELKKFDVIFVDGGNTFFLLQKVRESGFDSAIKEYLDADMGVYVGVSAGTVLAGPDVGVAEPWDDKSRSTLTDTIGLGLVSTAYSPHYNSKEKEIVHGLKDHMNCAVEALSDGQAIVVSGEAQELLEN